MSRLVGLYPAAWRARYGSELEDLIAAMRDDGHAAWRLHLDVLRGASREWLRAARGRNGLLMVLWAWALTVVAGGTVQKTTESGTTLLLVAAVTAALLVTAGLALAVPATIRFLRTEGFTPVSAPLLVALALSAIALVALGGLVLWSSHLSDAARNGHDAPYTAAFIATGLLGTAALTAWTALATTLARRIALSRTTLRAQSALAAGVALTLPAITVGAALTPGSTLQIVPAVVAMAVATALGATGARQALRA